MLRWWGIFLSYRQIDSEIAARGKQGRQMEHEFCVSIPTAPEIFVLRASDRVSSISTLLKLSTLEPIKEARKEMIKDKRERSLSMKKAIL